MRSLLCVSLVLLFATTAAAQFAKNPALRGKPPEADPAKVADPAADRPANPVDPAAGAPAGAPNAIFAALDADGDGVISKAELKKAIVALKKLDTDNDGNITLAECGGGAAAPGGAAAVAGNDPAAQWLDRIMAKDKNNDGKLTPNELNDNEKQMLQGADLNNDGAVDRQELAAMGNNNSRGGPNGGGATGGIGAGPTGRHGNETMSRFFQYDRNHDGRLTTDEVPPQAMAMLHGGDLNGDGAIDAGELQAIAAKMGDRMKAWGTGADPNANAGTPGAPGADKNRKRPKNQN